MEVEVRNEVAALFRLDARNLERGIDETRPRVELDAPSRREKSVA